MEAISIQAHQVEHNEVQKPSYQLAGAQVQKTVAAQPSKTSSSILMWASSFLTRASALLNSCVADSLSIT